MNHSKSWQLLSAPTFGQTIKEAWMEGATSSNANPNPGYGTQTVGTGGWTNGFDLSSSSPSVKTYNPANDTWVGVPSTNTAVNNVYGYMTFVRGDRGVVNYNAPSTPTILRSTGKIYSPSNLPGAVVIPAGKFQTIGNPYASAIDFINLSNANPGIDKYFYVWDPLFSGTYGGYRIFSLSNNWDDGQNTINYSGVNTLIQSGQAVFVHNSGGTDVTMNFNENNKVSGSRMTYRPPTSQLVGIRTFLRNAGSRNVDVSLLAINSDYSNSIDANDAVKLYNNNENLSIINSNKILSIDARSGIKNNDTVFYQLNNLTNQQYQIIFSPQNLMTSIPPSTQAYLIDKYSGVRTSISLLDSTIVNIDVNADVNSHDPSRLYLVFRTAKALPVRFINITASKVEDNKVSVNWIVNNESNISSYEIEKSIDGIHFNLVGSVSTVKNSGNASTYNFTDCEISSVKKCYYRIKSNELSDIYQYSKIVEVNFSENRTISIAPNPIKEGVISLNFRNQTPGKYQLSISNLEGRVVYKNVLSVKSAQENQSIEFGNKFSAGEYLLKVVNGNETIITIPFTKQ